MLLIFVIAGVVYVFYVDRQQPAPPKKSAAKTDSEPSVFKPVAPAANAQEGVSIQSLLSPVAAGSNTSMSIRSNAGSTCSILVTYNGGAISHDSGLAPQKTDVYGFVTWTWTVEKTVAPGTYPVKVTCVYNGRSGVVIGNLQVTAG